MGVCLLFDVVRRCSLRMLSDVVVCKCCLVLSDLKLLCWNCCLLLCCGCCYVLFRVVVWFMLLVDVVGLTLLFDIVV